MAEPVVVLCPSCGRKNRVDPTRAGAVCGACKASLAGASAAPSGSSDASIVELDDGSFRKFVIESPLPVLVDFHATWCGPCKALAPHVERVARERAGRVRVVKVDIDRAPATASKFNVQGVPTLVVVRGPRTVAEKVGFAPYHELVQWVDSALGS